MRAYPNLTRKSMLSARVPSFRRAGLAVLLLAGDESGRSGSGYGHSRGPAGEISADRKNCLAKVLSRGVTKSIRATLSDGKLTHDAHIQGVDKQLVNLYAPDGTPVPWRDSYKYNIAAYRLLRFLELDMTPVSVERKVNGKPASITWWADNLKMLELERLRKKIKPPDPKDWKRQMSSVLVFDNLIFNIDRNLENLAITNDWKAGHD